MVDEVRGNQILLWKWYSPEPGGLVLWHLSQLQATVSVELPCLNVGNTLLISTCSPCSSGTL